MPRFVAALTLWALAASLLLLPVASAQVSKLRRIATTSGAFASDGTRYVAWEVKTPSASTRASVIVLDTRTRRRVHFAIPCRLDDGAPAAAGRFLLGCPKEQALLDAHTGRVTQLPAPPPNEVGEFGPIWEGVGSRYVIGKAGEHARCHRTKRHESCTALYDIARRTMSEVPESSVPDPDRPGASPLCPALRRKAFLRSEFETLEGGLGTLSPLTSGFSYSDGVLTLAEIGESPGTNILIDRCDGSRSVLRVGREGRIRKPFSWNLELGAGILTWDTGHAANSVDEELEGLLFGGVLEQGTLTAYTVNTHSRRTWKLPRSTVKVVEDPLSGKPSHVVRGVFGYSAHAGQTIFWKAVRRISRACGRGSCSVGSETSDLYAAKL